MRNKGFTLIELLIVVAIIGIILVIFVGGWAATKHNQELKERYINLCIKDIKAENPYMDQAEIVERCEVRWEMAEKMEPKSDTTVIYVP